MGSYRQLVWDEDAERKQSRSSFTVEPPPYRLCDHVFVCARGNEAVLLDLKNDQYLMLESHDSATAADFIDGWPTFEETQAERLSDGKLPQIVRNMVDQGLISAEWSICRNAPSRAVDDPTCSWHGSGNERAQTNLSQLVTLIRVAMLARLKLKWCPIEKIVRAVRARRAEHEYAVAKSTDSVRALVESYCRLRMFLFSARDACLFDSLTLLDFLAEYSVYPSWVFGVRTAPFSAHCWVQRADTIFNDTLDHVRSYTPIMVA